MMVHPAVSKTVSNSDLTAVESFTEGSSLWRAERIWRATPAPEVQVEGRAEPVCV